MLDKTPLKLLFLRAALVLCGLTALAALVLMGWGAIHSSNVKLTTAVIAQVNSPNGKVVAILTRTDAGPTLDYGYLIDLKSVSSNSQPVRVANVYAAQKNKSEPGLTLVWRGDGTLEIHYYLARLADVQHEDETIDGQKIKTILKPVISSAPAI